MNNYKMKYGAQELIIPLSEESIISVIDSKGAMHNKSEEKVILDALKKPIASAPLKELVKPGETVCIIVSDITRAWQKMSVYLPYLISELNAAGITDKNITFLSSTGSHRKQTEEEHKIILGEKLYNRFKIIDHDSLDENNLVYLGTTTFGTPVKINKIALSCDHIIITGAIVYHLLAGWGGGKKSILPGISSYETIMKNHSMSLNPEMGSGSNLEARSGKVVNNPIHEDMLEAASFVRPTFMFNVIMDSKGNIAEAVAGNYVKAHEAGCELVSKMDGVIIKEKADMVIASAGGYPKDINFYQTVKTIINAKESINEGGIMIILSECSDGFGNEPIKNIIQNYTSLYDREKALRENYSIAKYIGYYITEVSERYNLILVSDMNADDFANTNIKVVKTVGQALELAARIKGHDLKVYLMPHGASTFPQLI
jgi:nickel-dependent lactate racemase